jgi:hypothetical protein
MQNQHPENWYIVATKENYDELNTWRETIAGNIHTRFQIGCLLLSKHHSDNSYYFGGDIEDLRSRPYYNDYQEITLEQFRQIINSKSVSETTAIQISRNLLNEYYEASTTAQKEYLSEHFKLSGWTTIGAIRGLYDLACSEWKLKIKANHPDCFGPESKEFDFGNYVAKDNKYILKDGISEELGLPNDFIQIRTKTESNYHCKAFYLNSSLNWELITDNTGIVVLVPTRKENKIK